MVLAQSRFIGAVVHSKVLIKTYVYQSIMATPTARVDHRIGCNASLIPITHFKESLRIRHDLFNES